MNIRNIILPLVVVFAFMTIGTTAVLAQEKMTMEEYEAQLAEWQKREKDANEATKVTEGEIENLKKEIASVEEETNTTWQEIYAMIESDEAGVRAYMSNLENLENEVDALSNLSADDLYKRKKEIDEIEAKLAELEKSKISALTKTQNKIADIKGKIAQLRATLDAARKWDEYVVVKGDYLWKIAKKDDIYADPYQWIRIYTKNRDLIKDPDLIYPDWNLKIQRKLESNEYLVEKGDYLKLIAGKPDVFGDPTKWTDIYEANKGVIEKSNKTEGSKMLYPYQVLIIPGK
jgi:nucleoid-associated protein YgaU